MNGISFQEVDGVLISEWRGDLTADQVAEAFDRVDATLERKRPFVHLIDARNVGKVSSEVRELAVMRLKKTAELRKSFLRGEAVVLESAMVRGILAAMYFLSRPGYPSRTFSDLESARSWARGQL